MPKPLNERPETPASIEDDRDAVLTALGDVFEPETDRTDGLRRLLPAADLPAQFAQAAAENNASVQILQNENDVTQAVAAYLLANKLPMHIVSSSELRHLGWRKSGVHAEFRAPADKDACGLTGVAGAAADCGAMALRSDSPDSLTVGLLPPHHIAVVHASSIVPSIHDLFARLAPPPSALALFCGPSRTADIEQTLVLGVHGPLAVHVLLIAGA